MERQKPVNSVQHNDEYSKALIESYSLWMGGTGFQQSEPIAIAEDGIPAEQKQGSGEGGGDNSTDIKAINLLFNLSDLGYEDREIYYSL